MGELACFSRWCSRSGPIRPAVGGSRVPWRSTASAGALQAALAGHGLAIRAHSGFNVWVPVRDEARVVHALADRGWAVAPGEPFRIRSDPAIRVTASMLEPPDAVRFAGDLAETLRFPRSTPV